ncbi:hypothetical protein BDN70DRAFT_989746 [Pholiota conissans]|uniref:BZIP domain-containing protein n=1 Tax=Pholiota conissans TaxID=109636 RepID=A0A9P6CXN0_9AGAR|nr:hypothetical protein BDN70DRAFT_989746 [Pholiota conissans]
MSSGTHTAQAERPQERSRNAKAQARHRAKRKAYIDQLEQSVTKLQIAVGYTSEQVSALPPPLLKIRELEQDNARLQKENDELRRLLDPNSRALVSDSTRRSLGPYQDSRMCDRDYSMKRRKAQDGVYISPSDTPPHGFESNSRPPPPLTIPQPSTHHYGGALSSSSHSHTGNQNGSLFNMHGTPTFQMPNTPSGSSATSSPPFSASIFPLPILSPALYWSSPVQMQGSSHLPMDHRQHISEHHTMPSYSQQSPHYTSVKIEDDHYSTATTPAPSHSSMSTTTHYSYSSAQSHQNHSNMDWHKLSMHDFFSGSVLTPARVAKALNEHDMVYYVWAAAEKVFRSKWPEEPVKKNHTLFISRVIDQLFFELASAIGDRIAGPCVVLISYKEHDDMSSIVETAQRMHRTFATHGVPRESVIVSIPATEAGILAARVLEGEGMITCLHFVTSLVHAQACVEAGVSAISVSVGPLLNLYERRRNTVYQNLKDHPGIEAIQAILAYFKVNGIKTKVLGADFRSLAEIGLLSECDAVCVSADQIDRLSWSQVPTASLDLSEEPQVILRARQAKFPTDLLTKDGGFATWFSSESRSLASTLLHDVLKDTQDQMQIIEHVVEEEVIRRMALRGPLKKPSDVDKAFDLKPKSPSHAITDNPSDLYQDWPLSSARYEEYNENEEYF